MRLLAVVAIAVVLIVSLAPLTIGQSEWRITRWAFYIPVLLLGAQYGSIAGFFGGVGASLVCAFGAIGREIQDVSRPDLFAPDFAIIGFLGGRVLAGRQRSILLHSARNSSSLPDPVDSSDANRSFDLNPLISIESSAKLLAEEDTPAHMRGELAGIISKECQHLSASIISMLQRIGEATPAQIREADITPILEAALREAAFVLCGRGVTLRKEIAPDLPRIRCCPDQIRRLFVSLLISAAQTAPAGAEVALRAHRAAEGVMLDIREQGEISFARRVVSFLSGPRTGMTSDNLASAYDIVSNHDGTIEAKLTVRKGMEFSVWLPERPNDPDGERNGVGGGGR